MHRVYNFAAGPATLPEDVLREAAAEMLDYQGTGMSVMEMSHRSKPFEKIIGEAEQDLRDLIGIPEEYAVLFLQGGAWTQFAMAPMNLMHKGKADFVVTGSWAKHASKEAGKYGTVRVVASSEDKNFTYIPKLSRDMFDQDADYAYICGNNTIFGTQYHFVPDTGGLDLVADLSSCILSEPLDISKYALVFAGAQKNVGPAGVTLVIARKDLITDQVFKGTPTMLTYKTHLDGKSLFNTPPCYAIYICGKVFKHLKATGGLAAMQQRNQEKAALLYDTLDASALYKGTAQKDSRSLMNVTFVLNDPELDAAFLKGADAAGLSGLKGHRSVGGMRASIYNAMPKAGVQALVDYMRAFEQQEAKA